MYTISAEYRTTLVAMMARHPPRNYAEYLKKLETIGALIQLTRVPALDSLLMALEIVPFPHLEQRSAKDLK